MRTDVEFAMLPIDLLTDAMLHPLDKVIAGLLAGCAGPRYLCWPCNRTLARQAGCSPRSVSYALDRLEKVGWITREPCPRTRRGQLIRLNWIRRKGGKTRAGGVATGCKGRVQPVATKVRTSQPELEKREGEPPEQKDWGPALSDWAANPRHPLNRFAQAELSRRKSTTPPGDLFGEKPEGVDLQGAIPDDQKCTDNPSNCQEVHERTQHNPDYTSSLVQESERK